MTIEVEEKGHRLAIPEGYKGSSDEVLSRLGIESPALVTDTMTNGSAWLEKEFLTAGPRGGAYAQIAPGRSSRVRIISLFFFC